MTPTKPGPEQRRSHTGGRCASTGVQSGPRWNRFWRTSVVNLSVSVGISTGTPYGLQGSSSLHSGRFLNTAMSPEVDLPRFLASRMH